MINILNIKGDIVKVLLGINIISLLICLFTFSKAFFIAVMVINILLSYTLIVMDKMSNKFTDQFKKMWSKNG